VIEVPATYCPEVRNALGLLEEIYVFFCGNKSNAIVMEAQADASHNKQLKRVVCIRWNSRQAEIDNNSVLRLNTATG